MKIRNFAVAAFLGVACFASAGAQAATFEITYSGQGTSGTAWVTGTAVGGGEYDLTSGVLHSNTLGNQKLVPGSGSFENTNGDVFVYDNKLFVPATAPASPDGANLTYAGGIVFQTALPSKKDIYFSAYYMGANNPTIFYFAGYDRSYGALTSFNVTAVPEASTWLMMLAGFTSIGFAGYRKSRNARNSIA
ncbi:MAG: PEP-CTERM sorting domain-containing protein [Rhodoblastus sp.]|uniref:PEP-CTERM sorting domain-containing protein n=1 Tax=Rhodoblastus sp. TaxID=1962975 RepID=UPI003F95B9D4